MKRQSLNALVILALLQVTASSALPKNVPLRIAAGIGGTASGLVSLISTGLCIHSEKHISNILTVPKNNDPFEDGINRVTTGVQAVVLVPALRKVSILSGISALGSGYISYLGWKYALKG